MRRVAAILLCALCLVPRWVPVSRAATMDQAAAPVGDLARALSMIPATSTSVSFTDWTLLKQYKGASNLTSQSPLAARIHFLLSLERDQATPSAYGTSHVESQALDWSWDFADLQWEETFFDRAGPPAYVLRFRDSFDFAPVIAHLIRRGFSKNLYHGIPIYAHKFDVMLDWATTTEIAIFNTAVLANRHLLVLSSSKSLLPAILDGIGKTAPALGDAPAVQATTGRLETVVGAFVGAGAAVCSIYDSPSLLRHAAPPAVIHSLHEVNELKRVHSYTVFATGYRDVGTRPLGLAIMEYGDANTARQDLPIRQDIVAHGSSFVTHQPYSDLVTVTSANVRGTALVFEFHLVQDRPEILFAMTDNRDVAYAGCP